MSEIDRTDGRAGGVVGRQSTDPAERHLATIGRRRGPQKRVRRIDRPSEKASISCARRQRGHTMPLSLVNATRAAGS